MPSATSHSGSGSKSSGPPPPSGSSGSEVAAGAGAAAPASQHPATGTGAVQTEAMKQILGVIDKKLRNLEKKKIGCFSVSSASVLGILLEFPGLYLKLRDALWISTFFLILYFDKQVWFIISDLNNRCISINKATKVF
ncbi:cell cycle associated protein 1 [Rhinolophus ferrumequinum]|uniref:Cell cycle associated protein 1 n=1 Tax=Rhinolophus ferrumequinum TaxID=59479 RepID=A0A7J7W613_RHIFE|nr:cell cycle associated protein 1 [Rhinolophus ferrumequinum]